MILKLFILNFIFMEPNYKKLLVWQKAIQLVSKIYKLTQDFPKVEIYGLTSQMRRSAVSVPSNVAEGSQRNSNKSFIQFLNVSLGSLAELDTQMIIAQNLDLIKVDKDILKVVEEELIEVRKMLLGLRSSL